jgi:spermidine synthase
MTFQVTILIAFQAIYGYLYYKLGLIITAFMGGLAAGGLCAVRMRQGAGAYRYRLIAAQAGLCIFPAAILPVFATLSGSPSGVAAWIGSNLAFSAMPLVSGFIGGFIFALAGLITGRRGAGSAGGALYALDLAGSCAGAVVTGTVLVPILGIPGTCLSTAALNAAALASLAASSRCRETGAGEAAA